MRAAENWKDYELLDASAGERLERWGEFILIRPDPQVLWNTPKTHPMWRQAHAHYHRSNTGGGHWERLRPLPDSW
ncbi:MAG: SAM-dependent methyltransferase, partial [Clostridia bacterium]|nr:SAM-dependent methyltransferase [Clostridia bacterium]